MKRNIFVWVTFIMVACPLFFTNCSNDPETDAVPPEFKEVVVSPNSVYPGESVNATIKFLSQGKSWYKIKYSWTLINYEHDYSIKGDGFSLDMKEPTFPIVVPDTAKAGKYTLIVNLGTVQAQSLFANGSPNGVARLENKSVTFTVKAAE